MGETAEVPTPPAVVAKVGAALDTVTGALEGLRSATVGAEPVEAVLGRLAETAVFALPDADAVSVTQLDATEARTIVATTEAATRIDEQQYVADRGPCLEAGRAREPVRAVVGDHAAVWPEFTAAAEQAGIRAYLSVPLIVEGADPQELVGSFNVYSYRAEAFDPFDEKLMRLLTTAASAAIGNARRWRAAAETVGQLETALVSRSVIDQAKGVLMALHRITSDEAFHRLVERSQRTNTKLADVAADLMRSATVDR
ncbi:ANTAR domain-containing response regulator [Rhodococcus opacus]|uniref:ANTAR domain-containing response regulator n=1 Tax=Rhodococcus opacus TaxID=37919 RepID=UPI00155AB9BC|nr:GAF and ANTAR domain-containing protein [Rhodococcus opacus]